MIKLCNFQWVFLVAFMLFQGNVFGQQILGHYAASQVVENKLLHEDMVLVYPDRSTGVTNLWMQVDLTKNGAFIEMKDDNRRKLLQILEAYMELHDVISTPESLPAKQNIGRFSTRAAFIANSGDIYIDSFQDILLFMKFAKSGKKTLGIYVGKLEADKKKTETFEVPNLWLTMDEVKALYYELSDQNINRFLSNKGGAVNPEVLRILQEDKEESK
ncbi:hypothetical protein KFE98_02340 [bacterium SCSIO 12741]|nr:hypothetical protein KFE98_02340 [bacterium SCSIO 12741]